MNTGFSDFTDCLFCKTLLFTCTPNSGVHLFFLLSVIQNEYITHLNRDIIPVPILFFIRKSKHMWRAIHTTCHSLLNWQHRVCMYHGTEPLRASQLIHINTDTSAIIHSFPHLFQEGSSTGFPSPVQTP